MLCFKKKGRIELNFDRQYNSQEKLLKPHLIEVLERLGMELYDFDYERGSSRFRVFVFNPSTKTASLEECVAVDRALGDIFESEVFPENIVLEVSSPGVYRSIKELEHFKMSIGELVKLRLNEKIELVKGREVVGKLIELSDSGLTIELLKEGKNINILFSNIKSANAEFVF